MFIFFVIFVIIFNLYLLYYSKKKNYLLVVWRVTAFVVTVAFLFISYFYINRFERNNFDAENNWCIFLDLDKNEVSNKNIFDEVISTALLLESSFNELKFKNPLSIEENLLPLKQSLESNFIQNCPSDTINKYLHIENNIIISYDKTKSKIVIDLINNGDKELSITKDKSISAVRALLTEIFDEEDISALDYKYYIENSLNAEKKYYSRFFEKDSLLTTVFDKDVDYTYFEMIDFFKAIKSNTNESIDLDKLTELYDYLNKVIIVDSITQSKFEKFRYKLLLAEISLFLEKYDFAFNLVSERLVKNGKSNVNLEIVDPEIFYIISKLSKNRGTNLGFESKRKMLEFAFDNINLNTDLINNLAYSFLYDFDRYTIYQAEESFRILSKLYPLEVKYIAELAFASRLLNNMDRSLELLVKAIELEPTNWYYLYSYGTGLYVRDKNKAKDVFLEAIEMGDSLNSNLYLGKIYYDEEDYEEALFYYRERVRHSFGANDEFKLQAMKGIRRSLKKIKEKHEEIELKKL